MIIVSRNKDMDAMVFTILDSPDYAEISSEIDKYYKGVLTKYTVWDYTKADPKKHLTGEETKNIAQQVKSYAERRRGGVDILIVPGILQHGLARIFQAYSAITGKANTALRTEICRNKEECFEYIRRNRSGAKNSESTTQK